MVGPRLPRPDQTVMAMARAYRTSQLVYVAANLGIADLLADGPKTCDELAAALEASVDALCRMMRGLAVLGLFEVGAGRRFALTPLGEPLRSEGELSVRAAILYVGAEQYRAWGDLLQTVMSGEPAFRRVFGDPFAYYETHPQTAAAFDDAMSSANARGAVDISSSYDFPALGTVVDVGGGEGGLLVAILNPRPRLRGVLLERGPVVAKARAVLERAGLLNRCRVVAGDFRQEVPRGGDVYVLKNVLHDWDDGVALEILTACRRSMKADARLVVLQRVMPDGEVDPGLLRSMVEADLMQMVYNGGRERTYDEYRRLFEGAGLRINATMQTGGVTWLLETRPGGPGGG